MKANEHLFGDARLFNEVASVGSYEFHGAGKALYLSPSDNILYVNKSVRGGSGSGADWANAVTELADALRWAFENREKGIWTKDNPLQIWVAMGVYQPLYTPEQGKDFTDAPEDLRDRAFLLVKDVQLFGGFPTSGNPGMEDRILKPKGGSGSVLSGDYEGDDSGARQGRYLKLTNRTGNAFHVVMTAGDMGEKSLLDGFTISGGGSESKGTFIRINSESFSRSCGGGVYNVLTDGSVTFRNLEIVDNMASSSSSYAYGGGVYNENKGTGTISWINNTVKNNTVSCSSLAAATFGGGVYNRNSNGSTMLWKDNVIENNIAVSTSLAYGGGVYNVNEGSMLWIDNIIGFNTATSVAMSYGGGIFNQNGGMMGWHDNRINGNKITPFAASFNAGGVYNRNSAFGTMVWTLGGEVIFELEGEGNPI
ncbi:hypothetical protein [Sphingobacterium yanglingense]|uniref:Parallel beta helix pectate lyase-like protein n=1 Tax=Sphingobacterium yanglingense TaxID=1437280 RepID=A0A4R6WK41_9SPHI|nr:hypothetical protein [Sphingobacterium yanglingense]TDQ79128.1 hypothetical protein CLV99_0560 [Sphingobacterium yanglingense]